MFKGMLRSSREPQPSHTLGPHLIGTPMNSDTIDWLLEHSASAYEREFKSTEQLRDRISFILSIAITPYAGIAVYLVTKFKGSFLQYGDLLLFSVPICTVFGLLVASASLVAYALIGVHGYANIPRPAQLLPYLRDHSETDKVLEDTKLNLIEAYAENIEHNFNVNQGRAQKLRLAQRLAVWSLIPLALSLPRFVYSAIHTKAEPQSVRIIEPVRITEEKTMSNDGKSDSKPNTGTPTPSQGQSQQQTTSASQGAPSPAPKPPFPKSYITLEHLIDKASPGKATDGQGEK